MTVVELRPEQQEAVDKLHNGAILCGGVGSGKTITALAYFYSKVCGGVYGDMSSVRRPHDLVVITTAKKRDSLDWEKEALKFRIGTHIEDGLEHGIAITVDSWNNIGDYEDCEDKFFIFDEQRAVGSGAWSKSFVKIAKSNKWILLSATPGDTWMDYIPVFLANGFYKNRSEFKRRHVVYNHHARFPKVERYTEVSHLVRLRNSILVDMPMERHTIRNVRYIDVDYDREAFEKVVKKRWHVYEERPLKDVAELFIVMRKVVNTHVSRLETVKKLLQQHPKLIVFYSFDYELEILRSLSGMGEPGGTCSDRSLTESQSSVRTTGTPFETTTIRNAESGRFEEREWRTTRSESKRPSTKPSATNPSHCTNSTTSEIVSQMKTSVPKSGKFVTQCLPTSFAVAEWNGHKHQPIPETDSWVYLVQYVSGAEGWNCIETDAMVFYSLTYSYKIFEQSHGRIDRMNTPFTDLWYYVLKSDSAIDRAIGRALKEKRNFNESDLVKKGKTGRY